MYNGLVLQIATVIVAAAAAAAIMQGAASGAGKGAGWGGLEQLERGRAGSWVTGTVCAASSLLPAYYMNKVQSPTHNTHQVGR